MIFFTEKWNLTESHFFPGLFSCLLFYCLSKNKLLVIISTYFFMKMLFPRVHILQRWRKLRKKRRTCNILSFQRNNLLERLPSLRLQREFLVRAQPLKNKEFECPFVGRRRSYRNGNRDDARGGRREGQGLSSIAEPSRFRCLIMFDLGTSLVFRR